MTIDGNITNKMKCFLHAPWRNSLLLLRQSTRLRSNHKSHYNTALARNVQITWCRCSNRIMFCTISKFIALVWKQSCIQFQVLSNSLVGTSIRQPMSIQQCHFPHDSVREHEFQWVASGRTFSHTKILNQFTSLPPPRRLCFHHCLSTSNFVQKLPNGFAWNFQGRLAMGQ